MAVKDGGPAFPRPHSQDASGNGSWDQEGMSLRDYFAAHAPSNPWQHFEPKLRPRPSSPDRDINPYFATIALTPEHQERVRDLVANWLRDPCYDLSSAANDGGSADYVEMMRAARPALESFEKSWRTYWNDYAAWEDYRTRALREQWPYHYADVMLAEQERP